MNFTPNVHEGTWQWRQARAIAGAVEKRIRYSSSDLDVRIDMLVAGLFGMSDLDCEWVLSVLNQAQGLEPIRTLRLAEPEAFRPLHV